MYYSNHAFMQHDYHAQLAHHNRMNKMHGYISAHYNQLCLQLLYSMSGLVMQRLLAHMITCW